MKGKKQMEKKIYETPEVTKVEIDFSDRVISAACSEESDSIAAWGCRALAPWEQGGSAFTS